MLLSFLMHAALRNVTTMLQEAGLCSTVYHKEQFIDAETMAGALLPHAVTHAEALQFDAQDLCCHCMARARSGATSEGFIPARHA